MDIFTQFIEAYFIPGALIALVMVAVVIPMINLMLKRMGRNGNSLWTIAILTIIVLSGIWATQIDVLPLGPSVIQWFLDTGVLAAVAVVITYGTLKSSATIRRIDGVEEPKDSGGE